jgi:hypothetical protein
LPAVSASPWTGIRLESLDAGPVRPSSVTMWSGGYLALGEAIDGTPFQAWTSTDGRTWTALPADTFGQVGNALAAAIPGGVMVVIHDLTGTARVYQSTDGMTWTSGSAPHLNASQPDNLASNGNGVVGIVSPDGLAFSADAITWEALPLPGTATPQVVGVAASGSGFVAVGAGGTGQRSPVAWWSSDGLHWTRSTVETHPGDTDGFVAVYAAEGGLVAISATATVPGLNSLWASSDGHAWRLSADNPLGVVHDGEGQGSMNGIFSGDGTRLLVYGTRAADQPTEYWNSVDAIHWTRLAITGQTTVVSVADDSPFLLRDGILYSGNTGEWFGAAQP